MHRLEDIHPPRPDALVSFAHPALRIEHSLNPLKCPHRNTYIGFFAQIARERRLDVNQTEEMVRTVASHPRYRVLSASTDGSLDMCPYSPFSEYLHKNDALPASAAASGQPAFLPLAISSSVFSDVASVALSDETSHHAKSPAECMFSNYRRVIAYLWLTHPVLITEDDFVDQILARDIDHLGGTLYRVPKTSLVSEMVHLNPANVVASYEHSWSVHIVPSLQSALRSLFSQAVYGSRNLRDSSTQHHSHSPFSRIRRTNSL